MNCLAFFLTKRLSTSKVSSVSCEQIRVALFFFQNSFWFFFITTRHPECCASSYALASKNDSGSYHCMWYNLFEHTLCIARCTVCVSYYAVCRFLTMHGVRFLLCTVCVSYYAEGVFLTMHIFEINYVKTYTF